MAVPSSALQRLLAGVLATALAGLAACDRGAAPTLGAGAQSGRDAAGGEPTGTAANSSLIALMVDAPTNVLYQAVRRFEASWSEQGTPQTLIYREKVSSDGQGAFAIETLDLIEPQLTQAQKDLFLLLQGMRQGLFFRYRDLRVRDTVALADNYVTTDTGLIEQVAGRDCAKLLIQRTGAPDRRFVLHVDVANGLVLRVREELLDGTLVTLTEFESLTLSPDLSGVVWRQPLVAEKPLEPGSEAAFKALGFAPHPPKMVPDGWILIDFAKVVEPTSGKVWAKHVYSDGVELLFFLEAKGEGPTFQVNGPPSNLPSEPDYVSTFSIGPWTLVQGRVHSRDLVVLGRLDEQVLFDLIQSSL